MRRGIIVQAHRKAATVPVTFLGEASVPPPIQRVLERGPKFALETAIDKHEWLASVRSIAAKVKNNEDKAWCQAEGVQMLQNGLGQQKDSEQVLRDIAKYFRESDLLLMLADKEGGFAVMPLDLFSQKAHLQYRKNFKETALKTRKGKAKALELFNELNLERLSKKVQKSEGHVLIVFFSVKTRKPQCPFRVIVTERDSWQAEVNKFLKDHLSQIQIEDPFRVRNADQVIEVLRQRERERYEFIERKGREVGRR